jgi:kynurenine formamidase
MIARYDHAGLLWEADLTQPLDISIPMGVNGPTAWYVNAPEITPVMENGFVGSIVLGGKVNFYSIHFNPHGNGTHTETLGHIDPNRFPISEWNGPFISHALVITVVPTVLSNGDQVILWEQIQNLVSLHTPLSLIIRTLPNDLEKRARNYSNTNFPYLERLIGDKLNQLGVLHLLVDLPSVDREQDNGELACHHAFWGFPEKPRKAATISELIYVNNEILDGVYCLFLQPPSFENDAAPSRPILYPIKEVRGSLL